MPRTYPRGLGAAKPAKMRDSVAGANMAEINAGA
jgi:hypothetical protein